MAGPQTPITQVYGGYAALDSAAAASAAAAIASHEAAPNPHPQYMAGAAGGFPIFDGGAAQMTYSSWAFENGDAAQTYGFRDAIIDEGFG